MHIHGLCAVFDQRRARQYMPATLLAMPGLQDAGSIGSDLTQQINPSTSLVLDNSEEIRNMLARPPLARQVDIHFADRLLFSGSASSISVSADRITLLVEA